MQLNKNRKIEVLLRLIMGCQVRFSWQFDNPIYSFHFQYFKYIATPLIYHHQKQRHKRIC
jgi:hypothetical protein